MGIKGIIDELLQLSYIYLSHYKDVFKWEIKVVWSIE